MQERCSKEGGAPALLRMPRLLPIRQAYLSATGTLSWVRSPSSPLRVLAQLRTPPAEHSTQRTSCTQSDSGTRGKRRTVWNSCGGFSHAADHELHRALTMCSPECVCVLTCVCLGEPFAQTSQTERCQPKCADR
jgi:hypothetical protein